MTQSSHREINSLMKRITVITLFMLVAATGAFAQSDEELIETVRASATKIFLDQASWTLPESFRNSGLAPSDKERLVQQLANATATCLVDALVEYATSNDVPLSDLVSDDGSFSLKAGPGYEFDLFLSSCIQSAWEAAGASLE